MEMSAADFYSGKNKVCSKKLTVIRKRSGRMVWLRFLAFVAIFIPFFLPGLTGAIQFLFVLPGIVLFLFFVKRHTLLEKRKSKLEQLVKLSEDELKALKHEFSHFYNGKEYLNVDHPFSYDLDLFGEGSLFQFLNRTSTISGRERLAGWLIEPKKEKAEIEERQEAIRELASIPGWRLHFLALGNLFGETAVMSREIRNWSNMELEMDRAALVKWLIRVLPVLTIAAGVISITTGNLLLFQSAVISQWILLGSFWKKIAGYFSSFGRKSELLAKYMQLLEVIENEEFKSSYLVQLQNRIDTPFQASRAFKRLKSLVKELEFRQNIVVGFILNSILLWDIRCIYHLWAWHRKHHEQLDDWLDVVAETDAMISLANYSYNHPDFQFPVILNGEFKMEVAQMGHPLLDPRKRICNDLVMNGWSKVLIVTGANMAGKSTFLRTLGINLILAEMGAPVCAGSLKITPVALYTDMRTTDSLLKNESYFFAELKRIKGVLDRLEKGERIFVVLDEMLKGTNSIDKLNGSRDLVRKLIGLGAVVVIATHDLKLSEMEEELPENVSNKCFEIRIENDELVFDYRLSEGVTRTMNATFIMKKMGII